MSSSGAQPSACRAAREALLDRLDRSDLGVQQPLGFHCDACRVWFERAKAQARALSALSRFSSVPDAQSGVGACAELVALDGRVVAELHAGCRQERAQIGIFP